jgi:NADH:ubiquinone oxidoreductase subunit H
MEVGCVRLCSTATLTLYPTFALAWSSLPRYIVAGGQGLHYILAVVYKVHYCLIVLQFVFLAESLPKFDRASTLPTRRRSLLKYCTMNVSDTNAVSTD